MEKFDVVVIGGGPAGYPAAIRAAQLGGKIALIEKEFVGGTCLNWGCIPTKAMLACSNLFWHTRHASEMGISVQKASFDYKAVCERKNKVVEKLRDGVRHLLKANNVTVIQGTASFLSRNVIQVKDGKETNSVEAANTIIASGSVSAMPSFIPRHEKIVESRGFLDMTDLPSSLLILGGGVIGCEFACLAAQAGIEVTIVEMLEDIIFVLDTDVRKILRSYMEKELGIKIITGKPLSNIAVSSGKVKGTAGDQEVSADMMLVAIGRKPFAGELNLASIGIQTDEKGFIPIDKFCRTVQPTMFAAGDITAGSTQLAHAATSQGICAAENILSGRRRPAETIVPACIFTTPEVASVGLTEKTAKEKGIAFVTGKFPFAALGKAMAIGETNGFVKWLAEEKTGRLIGAHAVGPHATELIAEAAVAVRSELTAEELGRTIHCHPTISESWMEAAHCVNGHCINLPPKKR